MEQKPLLQPALNYGAFYGLSTFAVFIALQYSGINPFGTASLITGLILIVWVCIAMKNYRTKFSGGVMSYGDAFKIGILTVAFGGGLCSVMIYIFGAVIHPSLLEEYKNIQMEMFEQTKTIKLFSESLMDTAMEGIDKTTLSSLCFNDFFSKMFGGLFVVLICAAIFNRSKPRFEEGAN